MRTILLAAAILGTVPAMAQQLAAADGAEHVVVYGTLPGGALGLDSNKVPGFLQDLDAQAIGAQHGGSLLAPLAAQSAGISVTDTQGNGVFQDLRFHGFEASPLQGTPQGIAVYQNGMRLNEAFGDTVNWEAIPQNAVAHAQVWSANPIFGLNALGGAVALTMKDGFAWQGAEAGLQGGSYGHGQAGAQWGGSDGTHSFYGAVEGVTDAGWRYHSQSNLARLYADAGWRTGDSEFHLSVSGAASGLGVVGPTPIEMTARDPRAVYTYPQTTRDSIASITVSGKSRLTEHWQIAGAAYLRTLKQRHVDGNDADFERCSAASSFPGMLCLEDDDFPAPSPKTPAFRDQFAVLDQAGAPIAFTPGTIYGTVDRTYTDSVSHGVTLQITGGTPLLGHGNYFTAGLSFDGSGIGFRSTSTLGRIFPDLDVAADPALAGAGSIIRSNGDLGYAPVTLGATTNYYGLYAVDALDLTAAVTLTAGLRINAAGIATRDRSGAAPELTGTHGYGHANPLAGLTWRLDPLVTLFGGYSQANRAPTPLELDCASATLPCLLEGSLVADPPLKQVVSETVQAGARGDLPLGGGTLAWSASAFRTDADNDIVSLASAIQGRGYFANVPATRRQGVDVTARYAAQAWSVYANWSYLEATYQFTGTLASPNNPGADGDGNVAVTPGRHIPLNPAHTVKAGGDVAVTDDLSLGGELAFTGSRYYDGDPSNLNAKLPAAAIVDLRARYRVAPGWALYGLIDNLFDNKDASYGTYFDPSDTAGLVSPALADARSITLRQPISFQLGVNLKF